MQHAQLAYPLWAQRAAFLSENHCAVLRGLTTVNVLTDLYYSWR